MISESTMVLEVVALGTPMGKILQVAERLQAMGKKALGRSFPSGTPEEAVAQGLAFTLPSGRVLNIVVVNPDKLRSVRAQADLEEEVSHILLLLSTLEGSGAVYWEARDGGFELVPTSLTSAWARMFE